MELDIGLSRSVLNLDSLRLDNSTMDKISSDPITFNLNFPCYNINGLGTPDINGFFSILEKIV